MESGSLQNVSGEHLAWEESIQLSSKPLGAEWSLPWRRERQEEQVATVYLKLALGSLRGLAQFICFLSTESAALNAESGPVTNPVLVASGWKGVKP